MTTALDPSTFPADFAWGVAIGAHQTEGGNVASDWWYRENQPDSPVAERCGDAVDGYHRWPEDVALAARAGFRDYRFGIEWSRIEPADGFISGAAVDHYRRIVESVVAAGMRPLVTLHHFTVPLWFAATGGWLRDDAAVRFAGYVAALAPVLDAGVDAVETINEPNIVAALPALAANGSDLSHGIPQPDPVMSARMVEVHRAASAVVRERHPAIKVGWGISVQDYQPEPGAEAAVERYAEARDAYFLRAGAGDDFVGIQSYTRARITPEGKVLDTADERRTQTGWEFYPEALANAVRRAATLVSGVPLLVTENGIATADDEERIEYTERSLRALRGVLDEGVDVRGYFHWSLLDNWEWGHWGPTFGLVAVDRITFARHPKPSLWWLGSLAPRPGEAAAV